MLYNYYFTKNNKLFNLNQLPGVKMNFSRSTGLKSKTAATFSGSNKLELIGTTAYSPNNASFCVGGWIKPTAVTENQVIMSKRGVAEWMLYFDTNDTYLIVRNAADSATQQSQILNGITAGAWHFVVGYYSASGQIMGLSINGSTLTADSQTVGVVAGTTDDFNIGNRAEGISRPFTGAMHDMFYIGGNVLTHAEITTLYNAGSRLKYNSISQATKDKFTSYWEFNEKDGTRVDRKGLNNLADNGSVLSEDASAENDARDNSPIFTWEDQSPNANHLTQATPLPA